MGSPEDISETEREALHDLQRSIEHAHRAFGALLEFHHEVGGAMDHLDDARSRLREAGRDGAADRLRDDLLIADVAGDGWSYELVGDFREGFLADLDAFESGVRTDLADGERFLAERELEREWRERAQGPD